MDLEASVEQLLHEKEAVIRRFYARFLRDCPAAEPFFAQVDLDKQASMLTMALMVVEAHARNQSPATQNYLHVLGDRHHDLGIPPELYADFHQTLLNSIADFHGADWSEGLRNEWDHALQHAITTMLEGYSGSHPF